MNKFKIFFLSLAFGFLIINNYAFADTGKPWLYFSLSSSDLAPGSEFTAVLFLDSPLPVNAFDIKISYSPETLEFLNYNNGDSIVSIWQSNPKAVAGNIGLQGGIFSAFQGKEGKIIKLKFKVIAENKVSLFVAKNNLYLADGQGTEISAETPSVNINISSKSPLAVVSPVIDNTPPELSVETANASADGAFLLVFRADDKESGVREFFMREKKWFKWSDWRPVVNPVPLDKNVWVVELKAVDNAGKETQKNIYLWDVVFKRVEWAGFFIVIPIILVIIAGLLYNKYRPKR
jgi:hypothetical protein